MKPQQGPGLCLQLFSRPRGTWVCRGIGTFPALAASHILPLVRFFAAGSH